MSFTIHEGDALAVLRTLPDESAQTCVTSPPYWGLRDYGMAGQIGLEETPDAYVARLVEVFREVRRVLRQDGTLWLNIGDSYAGSWGAQGRTGTVSDLSANQVLAAQRKASRTGSIPANSSLKPKDLIGIPWRVAFALQQPYYAGRITKQMDRIWLAAMLDAEGCFFIHKRKAGSASGAKFTRADGSTAAYGRVNDTYSPGVEICNTHASIVQRCMEIAGVGSISTQDAGRKQTLYRWTARGEEARMVVREVYPYLVGKMQQARIAAGCPTSGNAAEAGHEALKGLHHGTATDIDFAAPQPALEPGWYLRAENIWAKPNPMPESVKDRTTRAHEQVFLLSRSTRYFYDAGAVQEAQHGDGRKRGVLCSLERADGTFRNDAGRIRQDNGVRNLRSVWSIATQPFDGAHFATMPPELARTCIKAGSRAGDVVLDPFSGAGTTGLVARQLGRQYAGIELNPTYAAMSRQRIADAVPPTADEMERAGLCGQVGLFGVAS